MIFDRYSSCYTAMALLVVWNT